MTPEDAQVLVGDCRQRLERLLEWEREFVETLFCQLKDERGITTEQYRTLEVLWEKATEEG